jgi:hypothetical protein
LSWGVLFLGSYAPDGLSGAVLGWYYFTGFGGHCPVGPAPTSFAFATGAVKDRQPIYSRHDPIEILQVKEKLGGLRIRVNHETDAIRRRLLTLSGSPPPPARFAGNRDNGVKAIGSRPCATSTLAHAVRNTLLRII